MYFVIIPFVNSSHSNTFHHRNLLKVKNTPKSVKNMFRGIFFFRSKWIERDLRTFLECFHIQVRVLPACSMSPPYSLWWWNGRRWAAMVVMPHQVHCPVLKAVQPVEPRFYVNRRKTWWKRVKTHCSKAIQITCIRVYILIYACVLTNVAPSLFSRHVKKKPLKNMRMFVSFRSSKGYCCCHQII